MQSALLHFLYAWITATGGIGAAFQLVHVQTLLRDLVPLTTPGAAALPSPGTAITSPVSIFLLVK